MSDKLKKINSPVFIIKAAETMVKVKYFLIAESSKKKIKIVPMIKTINGANDPRTIKDKIIYPSFFFDSSLQLWFH